MVGIFTCWSVEIPNFRRGRFGKSYAGKTPFGSCAGENPGASQVEGFRLCQRPSSSPLRQAANGHCRPSSQLKHCIAFFYYGERNYFTRVPHNGWCRPVSVQSDHPLAVTVFGRGRERAIFSLGALMPQIVLRLVICVARTDCFLGAISTSATQWFESGSRCYTRPLARQRFRRRSTRRPRVVSPHRRSSGASAAWPER